MWLSYDWFDWWHPNWVRHHRYWYWYYPRPYGWYSWNHWGYSHYTEPLLVGIMAHLTIVDTM